MVTVAEGTFQLALGEAEGLCALSHRMALALLCSSPLQPVNSLRHIEKLLVWVWFCAVESNVNSLFWGLNKGTVMGHFSHFPG